MMRYLFTIIIFCAFLWSCRSSLKESLTPSKEEEIVETSAIVKILGKEVEGFYGSCVNVSISNQNADETIEYSLDGGNTWSLYKEPFEICSTTSLLYRSNSLKTKKRPALFVINIDRTPPEISAVIEPGPNKEGWNNTEVTVSFICKDNESGIRECPVPVKLMSEGRGQTITARAVDKVGNERILKTVVNIDRIPPVITIKGIEDKRSYLLCEEPDADFSATDELSGLKMARSIKTEDKRVGEFLYTVIASDRAGNRIEERRTYRVLYKFEGFRPPVSLQGPFKKGSVIPVRFGLSDGCGNPVYDAIARLSIELVSRAIPEGEPVELEEGPLFGDKGDLFWYDYTSSQYVYNLSTEPLFEGTWKITVRLDDGQSYSTLITIR